MKNDKRIVRTNRAIKEAFLILLSEKKYVDITVQDIATEAFINRNTFYLHFTDKEDLLEKYTTECLENLLDCIDEKMIVEYDEEYIFNSIKNIFHVIEKNLDFYRIMMLGSNSSYFTERLIIALENKIISNIDNTQEEMEFYVDFFINGFVGVLRSYLKKDDFSSVKLSRFLFQYINANPYSLLFENKDMKPFSKAKE